MTDSDIPQYAYWVLDAFSTLDAAMTDAIVPGMSKARAVEVAECVLDLRELRERFEKAMADD